MSLICGAGIKNACRRVPESSPYFIKKKDKKKDKMKKYIVYYYVPSQNVFLRGEFEAESKIKLLSELRELGYRIYNITSIPLPASSHLH